MGGLRARGPLRARQPHCDHRRQPARPARGDDGRLGPRRVRRPRARVRLVHGDRDRRHDVDEIDRAYAEAVATKRQPTVIVARTIKEGCAGGRGRERVPRQAARRPGRGGRRARRPPGTSGIDVAKLEPSELHRFETGKLGAPAVRGRERGRDAEGLRRRPRRPRHGPGDVVVLDGEVSNSTFAETFAKAHPERFFEMYIASSRWSPQRSACRRSAGGRSRPRSRRS